MRERQFAAPPEEPTIELQMVETRGPPAPNPGAKVQPQRQALPPAPKSAPGPQVGVARPPPPAPTAHAPGDVPAASQATAAAVVAAAPAKAAAPSALPPRMEINLGGGDSLTNAIARGPDIVQAKLDSRYRNRQPVYPDAAAMRGEAGTVGLLIEVGPDGTVIGVRIAETSGYALLDDAAASAVERWHFLPAARNGVPVPSEMPLRVVFQLH